MLVAWLKDNNWRREKTKKKETGGFLSWISRIRLLTFGLYVAGVAVELLVSYSDFGPGFWSSKARIAIDTLWKFQNGKGKKLECVWGVNYKNLFCFYRQNRRIKKDKEDQMEDVEGERSSEFLKGWQQWIDEGDRLKEGEVWKIQGSHRRPAKTARLRCSGALRVSPGLTLKQSKWK